MVSPDALTQKKVTFFYYQILNDKTFTYFYYVYCLSPLKLFPRAPHKSF